MFLKILINTGLLAFVRIAPPLFSIALIILIARQRGADLLGGLTIIVSYLAIFQMIAAFGLKFLLTREIAKDKTLAGRYLLHSLLLALPISILCAALMYLTVSLLGYGQDIRNASIIGGLVVLATAMIECCEGIFIGLEKISKYALVCFCENALRLAISVGLLLGGYGLSALIAALALSRLLALLANLLLLRGVLRASTFVIDLPCCVHLLRSTRVFGMIMILATLYSKMDVIILSKVMGEEAVGIYSAAFRLVMAAQILLSSFANSLYPLLSRIHAHCAERFREFSNELIRIILTLGIPVFLIMGFLSETIIITIFGSDFMESLLVFQILIFGLIPFSFITVADYILLSSYNQKADLAINCCALVGSVLLNATLIPALGITGAALATVGSTTLYFILQYFFLARSVFRIDLMRVFLRPAASGTLMLATHTLLRDHGPLLSIPPALGAYFLSMAGFAYLQPSEQTLSFKEIFASLHKTDAETK